MRRLLTASLLAFALSAGVAGAQEFSSLEEKMSAKEFREAGLDKLTPEELAALNAWLGAKMPGDAAPHLGGLAATAAAPVEDRRGFRDRDGDADESDIVTRIDGPFRGWRKLGERFVLNNGQVWEVTDAPSKFVVNLVDPVVRIEEGAFSAWYLSVDGYNARVKVKRIK